MKVRRAAADDLDAIAKLWRDFDHEVPPPTHEGPADEDKELGEVRVIIASELAFVAEDDDGMPVWFALARRRASGFGTLTDLFKRGYIALAILVLGRRHPFGIFGAALLFGFADALQLRAQIMDIQVPFQFMLMLPYLLTIVVLALFVRRTHDPAGLGKHYKRGQKDTS